LQWSVGSSCWLQTVELRAFLLAAFLWSLMTPEKERDTINLVIGADIRSRMTDSETCLCLKVKLVEMDRLTSWCDNIRTLYVLSIIQTKPQHTIITCDPHRTNQSYQSILLRGIHICSKTSILRN
jgi:ABC-type antimicrobial peptide transport system ATPase subunit